MKMEQFRQLTQSKGNWLPGGAFKQSAVKSPKPQFSSAYSQNTKINFGNRTFSGVFRKGSQKQVAKE